MILDHSLIVLVEVKCLSNFSGNDLLLVNKSSHDAAFKMS